MSKLMSSDPGLVSSISSEYLDAVRDISFAMESLQGANAENMKGEAAVALRTQTERVSGEVGIAATKLKEFAQSLSDYAAVLSRLRESSVNEEAALATARGDFDAAEIKYRYYEDLVQSSSADELEENLRLMRRWEANRDASQSEIIGLQQSLQDLDAEFNRAAQHAIDRIQNVTHWDLLKIIAGAVDILWHVVTVSFEAYCKLFRSVLLILTEILNNPLFQILSLLLLLIPGWGPIILLALSVLNFAATAILVATGDKNGWDLVGSGVDILLSLAGPLFKGAKIFAKTGLTAKSSFAAGKNVSDDASIWTKQITLGRIWHGAKRSEDLASYNQSWGTQFRGALGEGSAHQVTKTDKIITTGVESLVREYIFEGIESFAVGEIASDPDLLQSIAAVWGQDTDSPPGYGIDILLSDPDFQVANLPLDKGASVTVCAMS